METLPTEEESVSGSDMNNECVWKKEVAKNTKGHIWQKIAPQKLEYGESYEIFNSMTIWSKLSKHVVLVTKLIHLIPY